MIGNITEEEYQTFVEDFNATEDTTALDNLLHQLFEKAAEEYPNHTALVHYDSQISYRELNESANSFSRSLVERGVQARDVVAIAMERSIELVMAMLAVMKTGATYVPIDLRFPAERIGQILDDAVPRLVITSTNPDPNGSLSKWAERCVSIEERDCSVFDVTNLDLKINSEDLAYILYTSGSTGKPKGVEISHGASCNDLISMSRRPGVSEGDRVLAITTICFDLSTFELLVPIFCGATSFIAHSDTVKDPQEIARLLRLWSINVMQATPSTWSMLLASGWEGEPRLTTMITTGEPLTRHLADRLLPYADAVWNGYGPTETTYASFWRVESEGEILIGSPVLNDRMYILDEEMLPVPMGSEGELYIGGGTIATGYRNQPELTKSRFIKNHIHGGRMFKTGDMARFLAPGRLQALGRIDGMVKIRGFRVELGDIESTIVGREDIIEAVVVSRDGRLVAYYVPKPESTDEATGSLEQILRSWVANHLPEYMVPAFFVKLDALPRTPNQKIDRLALPDPTTVEDTRPAVQPASELEQQILGIWAGVLGHSRIGTEDNFFQIGGDSVRVVLVQAELEKVLGRRVSAPELFQHYTIKALAAHLTGADNGGSSREIPLKPTKTLGNDEVIAIISMACRLPGGVASPQDFWELLKSGHDAIGDIPKDRWDAEELYDADPDAIGKSYCRQGGFLDSIYSHDSTFFGISPQEAQAMDPAQNLMLETCWEGIERAGYTRDQLMGSDTGVFIGTSSNIATNKTQTELNGYGITGGANATMSGRISYVLGLEGPSVTIDTACSSSLVSTHFACNALRLGECDLAVAGGVTLLLTPGIHTEFSKLRGLSADGRCRAFSDDTGGTGFSEGSAVVLLKRLSDAERDGDKIHGILRGTAVTHGGRSAGLTVPSTPGQARLIRKALGASGLQGADIDYIEAHGTATKLGDPIEGAALAEVFGGSHSTEQPLLIGSAKSNIGHTQAAAGMVGMLKVVLALQNGLLPRTLHVNKPTPAIDWAGAKMALVQEEQDWLPAENHIRRAGVSAFGIGGTGAHVIVEEPPKKPVAESATSRVPLPSEMPFLLSAQTNVALQQQAANLLQYLDNMADGDALPDVACSLATTRNHFSRRLALKARDKADLRSKLVLASQSSPSVPSGSIKPHLAMLFTGQGSQYLGMGKALGNVYPVFREALEEIASHFTELETPLLDVMWAEHGSASGQLLNCTDFSQAALFSLEVALYRLWSSWGIRPDAVAGHSVGEFAAAHIAGVMDLPSACRLVAARGRLMQAQPATGLMASLEAGSDAVTSAINEGGFQDKICIAGYNTPTQTVISGDVDAVEALIRQFVSQNRKAKMLTVSHAFHSHHMDGMMDAFRAVAETVKFSPPSIPLVSGYSGKLAQPGQVEKAEYWVLQTRNAVRFTDCMQTLADMKVNTFIELGPRAVLSGMGAACLMNNDDMGDALWLPSLSVKKEDASVMQSSLLELHIRSVPIDWAAYFMPFDCQRVELPTYPFQRKGSAPTNKTWASTFTSSSQTAKDLDEFKFEMDWRPVDSDHPAARGTWGILCPTEQVAWASSVSDALSHAGVQLQQVEQAGDAESLNGLVCLWDSDATVLEQAHGLTEVALNQLQHITKTSMSVPVVWITRQAVGAGEKDKVEGVGAAPLWGLARTACTENPDLCLRLIDLDADQGAMDNLAWALGLDAEPECALRNGQVLIPRMERVRTASPITNQTFVRTDGAVLITGGLGDIARSFSRWLIKHHSIRDLVLTSRRGLETPGAEDFVSELAKLGATATVVAGDMGSRESIQAILDAFTDDRPLRGIVHTAGVLDDSVLSSLTPQRCSTVFRPKIDGAWHLHELTKHMGIDFFIMCSSLSGIIGNAGQANYSAANTFLDALAHARHAQGLPATSASLGLWGGDGMRARLRESDLARYAKIGMLPLQPDDGLEVFKELVLARRPHTIAAAYCLDRLRSHHESAGGIPTLFKSLLGGGSTKPIDEDIWDLAAALGHASRSQHGDIVIDVVQKAVAKVLGFDLPGDVDIDQSLQEMGIDSLTAILTRNQLVALTGLTLSVKVVFDHPNVRALAQFLLAQLQDSVVDSASESASSQDSPVTTPSEASFVDTSVVYKERLDPSFTFTAPCTQTPAKTALVTGATGFVGAFVVGELLKRGVTAYALVRAGSAEAARDRMVDTLTAYGFWKPEFESQLVAIAGDVSKPLLGLSEDAFNELADKIDSICHSAALVDWLRPLEEYIGPNVTSAHEVLRLASRGRGKTIHLISTVAVVPRLLGYHISEDQVEYGYSTSKWMGEQMVAAARWRGAKASIYRLPYVTASASTGHFRLDRGDFLHNLVVGCLDLGSFPSLDTDLSIVLPVDYLAQTVVSVMTDDAQRAGQDFTFINKKAPTFNEYFKLMSSAAQGQEILPFLEWKQRALDYAVAHPTSSLARIAAVLDSCTNDKEAAELFEAPDAGSDVLGYEGYPIPPVDEKSIKQYIDRIQAARK